jgi:tetratricopeptide (TPR) repeat protein
MNDYLALAIEAFINKQNQMARGYVEAFLATEPLHPKALELLGLIVAEREGDLAAGVALIQHAIDLAPEDIAMRSHLMQLLRNAKQYQQAYDVFGQIQIQLDRILDADPDDVAANYWYAILWSHWDDQAQTQRYSKKALQHNPYASDLWLALALHYQRVGLLSDAEDALWNLVTIGQMPDGKRLLATCFKSQNKIEPAIALYRWAQLDSPSETWLSFWEGELHLLKGHYARGWPLYAKHYGRFNARYENGQIAEIGDHVQLPADLNGKIIRIFCDQGIGDSVMYMRFLPLVKARGATIQIAIRGTLVRLCEAMGVIRDFIVEDAHYYGVAPSAPDLDTPDFVVSISTLAMMFQTEVHTIPYAGVYLQAPPDRSLFWRQRLQKLKGKKVGIIWAGNPAQEFDARRSMPFKRFSALFDVHKDAYEQIHFVSLQKFPNEVDAQELWQAWVINWMDDVGDYADTAALMGELDLVISVCTSGANVAGALGLPVWVLLSFAADWRWHLNRTDSPWYQSAQLIRQPKPDDWDSVLSEVRQRLIEFSKD